LSFSSPAYGSGVPTPELPAVGVIRFGAGRFSIAGNDVYRFDGLAPGFAPYQAWLTTQSLDANGCNNWGQSTALYVDGNWNIAFDNNNNNLIVNRPGTALPFHPQ